MDFAATARVLETVCDTLTSRADLDPDAAVRLAVFGDPEAKYPGDGQPGADLFDNATSAIESYCGYQGNGIADIPRQQAAAAARNEAARYRSYGGGRS